MAEQSYVEMAGDNQLNYSDNSSTIAELVKAINANLAQLHYIQNDQNINININQERLSKQGQLLQMQNDDMLKQLRELEIIQSNIANKNRMIDQYNIYTSDQDVNIRVLYISIVLAIILFFSMFIPLYRIIIIVIVIICYIILLMYSYDIFYFRTAFSYINKNNLDSINKQSQSMSNKEYREFRDMLSPLDSESNLDSEWNDYNCSCPAEEEGQEKGQDYVSQEDNSLYAKQVGGQYYYDGSAPAQLITPYPRDLNLNENIDWVDYTANGITKYNQKTNLNLVSDQNFYNIKGSNDQRIQLKKALNNSAGFVNDKTDTANI